MNPQGIGHWPIQAAICIKSGHSTESLFGSCGFSSHGRLVIHNPIKKPVHRESIYPKALRMHLKLATVWGLEMWALYIVFSTTEFLSQFSHEIQASVSHIQVMRMLLNILHQALNNQMLFHMSIMMHEWYLESWITVIPLRTNSHFMQGQCIIAWSISVTGIHPVPNNPISWMEPQVSAPSGLWLVISMLFLFRDRCALFGLFSVL